jgi:cephalosporin hydroxylase
MYTREQFEQLRITSANEMAADSELRRAALDVLVKADRYNWVHQTSWFGEPILQLPQDMFALQEIIFNTRPKFIIGVGVAWGGSLLFYSTLMEILGGRQVIGVDIYIPEDLTKRIGSFGKISDRIIWIRGSSTDETTIHQIKSVAGDSRDVMINLDSKHTHEHVLKELRLFSPLVGKGHYIVCSDTVIEDIPEQKHRPRAWGPGNSPKTALDQFLKENDRFEVDRALGNKLLFTCNPGGYLRCCKDDELSYGSQLSIPAVRQGKR